MFKCPKCGSTNIRTNEDLDEQYIACNDCGNEDRDDRSPLQYTFPDWYKEDEDEE